MVQGLIIVAPDEALFDKALDDRSDGGIGHLAMSEDACMNPFERRLLQSPNLIHDLEFEITQEPSISLPHDFPFRTVRVNFSLFLSPRRTKASFAKYTTSVNKMSSKKNSVRKYNAQGSSRHVDVASHSGQPNMGVFGHA